MKRKMILPVLAVLFAVAGAFASKPVFQSGWFYVSPASSSSGGIDNTTQPCSTGLTLICKIDNKVAYNSAENARTQNPDGVLKYDNN